MTPYIGISTTGYEGSCSIVTGPGIKVTHQKGSIRKYPLSRDEEGNALDGSKGKYTLTSGKDALPPVNAFWSLTMYDGKTQLMIENPLNRYLLNSTLIDKMKQSDDGSSALHFQNDAPYDALNANWLPAPDGPFYLLMRLYWPKKEILDGTWKQPVVKRTKD